MWLQGPSGRGKTTLASSLCNILPPKTLHKLDIETSVQWDTSLPTSERCGVLFQSTTLLDELTIAGNLAAALDAVQHEGSDNHTRELKVKQLMEMVGLQFHQDAGKKPTELSGGMGRRASLALQLAQKKHVIFLDEPFTGLDRDVAVSIAKQLVRLRKDQGVAFILISHELDLAKMVMQDDCDGNVICKLDAPTNDSISGEGKAGINQRRRLYFGTTFLQRFWSKLLDYFWWSLPLILLAFSACGLAISMLTCDTLGRIDVTEPVLKIVDKEIRPMIKMLTGQEATPLHLIGVKMKVSSMLNTTVPPAKATLYAIGMAKLFVLEIGPLLSALLLCGRIGGSYAGKVATMEATSQNKLLKTLGISPLVWSFYPAVCAAAISGPFLTSIGTFLALYAGGKVGPFYGIGSEAKYWEEVLSAIFPTLRLRLLENHDGIGSAPGMLLTTFSDSYLDSVIEIATYPIVYHVVKSFTFLAIIMGVAEGCARARSNLTPRGVPRLVQSFNLISKSIVVHLDSVLYGL